MRNHWAEEFVRYAERRGIPCQRVRHSNGWLETAVISGCDCFTKSMSYNEQKRLYFQGVDPGKLSEKGHAVVLCGGRKGDLADVFVIPWRKFQYKFHVRDREGGWTASFEGGSQPVLDLTDMRFDPKNAVARLQAMECRGNAGKVAG